MAASAFAVESANTVGFTTKSISADTFYLCGIQFEDVGNGTGAISLNDLVTMSGIEACGFLDMDTSAAQIQVRNAANTGYDTFYFINDALDGEDEPVEYDCWADSNGYEATGGSLPVGAGFWLKSPSAGSVTFSR